MSDVETAQTGATAAPVENTAPPQEQTQVEATESATEESAQDRPRDDKGRFEPVQKRINELTRRYHEENRRAQELERRLSELESSRVADSPPDPNIDIEGFVEHLARQRADELYKERQTQAEKEKEHARLQNVARTHAAREADYAEAHPDYEDAAHTVVSVVGVNPVLGEVLMASDYGPAIVHHLGTHLDDLIQITQMPPHLAAAAIARIEAKVSAVKPKPVTQAPAPVPNVKGGSQNPTKDQSRMTDAEWFAEWNKSRR